WNNPARHNGIPTELEDIQLALDQQTEEEKLDDLHKIDLRGKHKEDWPTFHKKYIKMWQRRYDYFSTCEPFLVPELATSADYMDWFRHNDKLYLLATLERSRQCRRRRPRQGPINPSSGEDATAGSTSTSSALKDSIVVQPLGQ
ncbi:hypothetical protein Golob_026197, partial [Gossypium lobatum]|nr:hypothetical protein [Gossypium lobatum]